MWKINQSAIYFLIYSNIFNNTRRHSSTPPAHTICHKKTAAQRVSPPQQMRFDMGDLDTSLIQEFANRPAFYNKTSPHYKDKAYIEHAWLEISTKLGYSCK